MRPMPTAHTAMVQSPCRALRRRLLQILQATLNANFITKSCSGAFQELQNARRDLDRRK